MCISIRFCITVVPSSTSSSTPTLKHVISDDDDRRPVVGMTSIHNRLFVLRHPSEQRIQVYDAKSFEQQQSLQLNGIREDTEESGLTSCVTNSCLYFCDSDQDTVYKVVLSENNTLFSWRTGRGPSGLSVNITCNLIVACYEAHRIQEYNTTNGSLVREICLESKDVMFWPLHAIQVSSDRFVLSCWDEIDEMWNVVEVDTKGRFSDCLIDQLNSTSRHEFDYPCHLSVDENNEFVFVADTNNDRILILNRSMNRCGRELNVTTSAAASGRPRSPFCLCLDESQSRLFVGEWRDQCRVLVFDNVI
jgi:DNA-binding beta-propeller fold protein YncE